MLLIHCSRICLVAHCWLLFCRWLPALRVWPWHAAVNTMYKIYLIIWLYNGAAQRDEWSDLGAYVLGSVGVCESVTRLFKVEACRTDVSDHHGLTVATKRVLQQPSKLTVSVVDILTARLITCNIHNSLWSEPPKPCSSGTKKSTHKTHLRGES